MINLHNIATGRNFSKVELAQIYYWRGRNSLYLTRVGHIAIPSWDPPFEEAFPSTVEAALDVWTNSRLTIKDVEPYFDQVSSIFPGGIVMTRYGVRETLPAYTR